MSYRICVGDDHVLMREGLKLLLAQRPEFEVVGEAGDGLEMVALVKREPAPDAVIIDISMPRLRGIEAIREIKGLNQAVRILVLTMHKDEELLSEAFLAGADGFLLKEDLSNELFTALDSVLKGEAYVSALLSKELRDGWVKVFRQKKGVPSADVLTTREMEVLKLVAEGESSKEIAARLGISARTVDHHRASIMEKLNLKGMTDLIRYALSKGYIS